MSVQLRKFLENIVLDEISFWKIIAQVLKVDKTVGICGLYQGNLCMDTNVIFINERTLELYFIYQPLIGAGAVGNIFALINDIVYLEIKKCVGMPTHYLTEFQTYLSQGNHYRTDDIMAYVYNACPQIKEMVGSAESGKSGFLTTNHLEYENHYDKGSQIRDDDVTAVLGSEDTILLEEDAEATTLLMEPVHEPVILISQKTQEHIKINAESYSLGKGQANDYCIQGNSAVSRRHALVIRREENYYIKDVGSTNGTFLNGRRLLPEEEALLAADDEVKLADEIFTVEMP
jgi:hypothetical protein